MPVSSVPMIPRDATLTVEDATGTPISLTIVYEDGDFQTSEMEEGYMNAVFFKDRGVHYNARKTEEQDITFTFTAHVTAFTDSSNGTPLDAVMKLGKFSAGVSTHGGSTADVWMTKWTFTAEATNYGAAGDHVLAMTKVRTKIAMAEGVPGKWTITGTIFNPSSTITWTT